MQRMTNAVKHYWRLVATMSDSLVEAFRFRYIVLNIVIRIVFFPITLQLGHIAYRAEKQIQRDKNLQGISRWLIERTASGLCVHDVENVPIQQPVLFVGNHAGMGDAISLLMSAPRQDIHTLAFNNGMLQGLDIVRDYVIVIDKDNPTQALRESVRHLKAGKSILVFPRGKIEDDPALYLDLAIQSLDEWSESIEFFVKHVPDLQVMPFGVGGVISRKALNNPIVKQYQVRDNRHFLALTFQMMFQRYREPIASIFYGEALTGESATLLNVQTQMRDLLCEVHDEQTQLLSW